MISVLSYVANAQSSFDHPHPVGLKPDGHYARTEDDGPSHGGDRIFTVATDDAGAVYVAGTSEGGIVTIKYAGNGTPVWTNTYFGTGGSLFFGGLTVDAAGNAYVLPVEFPSDFYFLVKYDVNGNAAWTNSFQYSATSSDAASDLTVDAAGNIYVTGFSFDSSSGGNACQTLKYASNGALLWNNRGSFVTSGSRVMVDRQQNIIVVGETHGGTAVDNYYAVVKYSNAGSALWTNIIASISSAGGGVPRIAIDPAGNVLFAGGTPGAAVNSADFTMRKFTSAGVPVWTNRFIDPGSGTQEFDGAATDNAGNLYCVIASASPGGANYNYVTVKYAATGTALWTNRYNGPANSSDLTRAMTVDKAGNVYVTGTSSAGGTAFSAFDWATVKYADNLLYVPPPNFVGQDTITFTAIDSSGNSATGTVTVVVTPGVYVVPGVVAPSTYTTGAGNAGLNTLVRSTGAARTYQLQFTPAALGGLPTGARITGIGFRLSTNSTTSFPSNTVTWADYQITLAQAANPIASMSPTFALNLLNPVLVKTGALSVAANQFTAGGNPNAFSTMATLATPYVYQGGDLVVQFTHTGSDSAENAFLDAASSAAPGYGTAFRAFSANSFSAATGASASATIVQLLFTPNVTQTLFASGNQAILSGLGGFSGATYRILTATNIALPTNQWQPIATNRFGVDGGFSYTNLIQPGTPTRFFQISVP